MKYRIEEINLLGRDMFVIVPADKFGYISIYDGIDGNVYLTEKKALEVIAAIQEAIKEKETTMDYEYQGQGWYMVEYSDGGQAYTNDGAVWCDDYDMYEDLMCGAEYHNTDTHIAHSVYLGEVL